MTCEEMKRSFEFMKELQVKLEQYQVESEERHARFEVSVQRSIDSISQQQAKFESGMAEVQKKATQDSIPCLRLWSADSAKAVTSELPH